MDAVIEKLNENLQVLYRKAIDADKALEQLTGQGKAKHSSVFPKEAGFNTSSNRFAPYVAELTDDIAQLSRILEEAGESQFNSSLSAAVKKMESLFVTLAQFKGLLAE